MLLALDECVYHLESTVLFDSFNAARWEGMRGRGHCSQLGTCASRGYFGSNFDDHSIAEPKCMSYTDDKSAFRVNRAYID
jgi:hypothetical protein